MQDRQSFHPASHDYASYYDRAQWPLQGLYFLLPLLIAYEAGTFFLQLPQNEAEKLLKQFFQWFGVTGLHLPAIIVMVVLFSLHLVRRDPWRPEPKLYGVMWAETFGWALPLFVFSMVLVRGVPAASTGPLFSVLAEATPLVGVPNWQAGMVFSIGAGIYEELLFRLIALNLLHLLLVDVLALPEKFGGAAAVALSAMAFAMYHFNEANNPFTLGLFAFYTLAGVYLALIYVTRGFGIVVGVHALYDIMVVSNEFRLGEGLIQ